MLLCDTCDRECHTYCQYPVLWEVPKGEWQCPICKEVSKWPMDATQCVLQCSFPYVCVYLNIFFRSMGILLNQLLPTRASEQGKTIGVDVHIYI